MDWRKGFGASYYASIVDPNTWKSIKRFEIKGGAIRATGTGLQEAADIECNNFNDGEKWIRIYLIAKQDSTSKTIPMYTGLSCCPDDNVLGYHTENTVQLFSVLKPCDDIYLPRGWYVPAGSNGAIEIKKLLSPTPAPVIIDKDAPTLSSNIIAENDETNLSMINKILLAINWRLRIEGDGTIHITDIQKDPVVNFDPISYDCIEPEIKRSYDWYSCPNVFRAISEGIVEEARDESPDSPLSIINRGREIWYNESSCHLNNNETLKQYAARRLKEEQKVATIVNYDRRFHPDIRVGDVVNLNYPAQRLVGNFIVSSYSIELGYGARTSEEVMKI